MELRFLNIFEKQKAMLRHEFIPFLSLRDFVSLMLTCRATHRILESTLWEHNGESEKRLKWEDVVRMKCELWKIDIENFREEFPTLQNWVDRDNHASRSKLFSVSQSDHNFVCFNRTDATTTTFARY